MKTGLRQRGGPAFVAVAALLAVGLIANAAAVADVAKVTVFAAGQDGYHTYRIPAIVKATSGDLLAFAEGRKTGAGDHGDIDIVLKRSADNGRTWGPMQLVQDEWGDPAAAVTIGNPVPVVDRLDPAHPGRIWLAFTRNNERVLVTFSDDHGATWQIGAVDTRAPQGQLHPNECVAVELVDGRIYVNARDQHGSDPATRAVASSSDGGATFDAPFAAEPVFTTPVVQNSAVRFAAVDQGDARNVLVYSGPGHATKRRDLTIWLSEDEGESWSVKTVLHRGPAAYSDLVKLDGETIGVLYEAGQSLYDEIIFASFGLETIAAEP